MTNDERRGAIARALVHNPSVVVADEPTASLDTERAFQVVETFAKLIHEQNRAGIMVTHDLRLTHYVDRVIQMRDGKVVRVSDNRDDVEANADNDCIQWMTCEAQIGGEFGDHSSLIATSVTSSRGG